MPTGADAGVSLGKTWGFTARFIGDDNAATCTAWRFPPFDAQEQAEPEVVCGAGQNSGKVV